MTYVTYIIYALLAAMLVWNMKYAGKNTFHADATSLEAAKCLQGFSALCVIFHHISQEAAFRITGELSLFPDIGPQFVGVFFFWSGFGLIKSLRTKPGYLDTFPRHRILSVIVPFYTMTIAYGIYFLMTGMEMPVMRWIMACTGLVLINTHAWYAIVITLLYLAFYRIFSRVKNEKTAYTLMALVITVQIVFGICCGHLAWWTGEPFWWQTETGFAAAKWWMMPMTLWFQGEWWVNATMTMFAGMLFARFEKEVTGWIQKRYFLKWAVTLILCVISFKFLFYMLETFSYWTDFGTGHTLGFGAKFGCLGAHMLCVTLFSVLIFITMMKVRTINPLLKFLGNRTLEIYLMHNIFLMIFRPVIEKAGEQPVIAANHSNLLLYAVLVPVCGILLATVFHRINKMILKNAGT